jgi:sugar lactone lactonase YvrE
MACAGATDKYGDGCQGTAMSFTSADDMRAVVADPFGNVYVSDTSAALVRRITPNGVISNFAGLVSGTACIPTATTGCTPTLVSIGKARGLGSDASGNIYIANYTSNQVLEIKQSTGLLYLVAGNGTAGSTGDGNAATSAEVDNPRGAWGDTIGNVYIAESAANKIRVVDAFGSIHTFAGNGTAGSNGDGAPATSAEINNPQGVIADANLNVYIADGGGRIRVVCVTCGTGSPLDGLLAKLSISSPVNGDIYTVAGSGSAAADSGYTVPVLSTGVSMAPQKMAFDISGNLYISDSNGFIWFLDFHTGYLRAVAKNATICSSHTDNYGDGCPATQASFGSNGGNGMGVGADALGNVYISDSTNLLVRKVITGLASPGTATTSTKTLPVELHFVPGDNLAATNGLVYSSTEWSLTTPSCTTNADTTADCLLSSSFTPAVPGSRSTPLAVNSSLGNTATLALTGTGLGAGATLDPASKTNFGSGLAVAGLAADNAGNIYVSDSNSKKLFRFAASAVSLGSSAMGTTLGTFVAPGAVAVDARGYSYVADTSAGTVTQISPAGVSTTLPFTFTTPAGLAVDTLNNLYVSDSSAKAVYQISPLTGAERTLGLGTLVSPTGLAVDPSDNLLVADPGAPAIYRYNFQTGVRTTVTTPAVAPSQVVTDAAGNLLIADTASILAVPASSNSASFTVSGVTPAALAIDSAGNLYTGSSGGVLKLKRTQGYVQYAVGASPQTVNLLDSGNQIYSATAFTQTDSTDYSLVPTASMDCVLNGSGAGTLAVGGRCALTASYTPATYVTTTDSVTFNGNLSNAALSMPSSVNLTLTGPATAPTPTVTLGAFSPASPVYGQTVTLSVTVSGTSIVPAGSVVFTVDSSTYPATLSGGSASVMVSGLSVGVHNVSVAYTSSNGYAPASSGKSTLSVVLAPSVTLTTTATLTKISGGYQATVTITNTGGSTAANVQITSATLGTATATSLPVSFGSIAGSGGSVKMVITFPSSAGADGAGVVEKYSGTYTGGSFAASIRATLP